MSRRIKHPTNRPPLNYDDPHDLRVLILEFTDIIEVFLQAAMGGEQPTPELLNKINVGVGSTKGLITKAEELWRQQRHSKTSD
jgi:hypothetical protein